MRIAPLLWKLAATGLVVLVATGPGSAQSQADKEIEQQFKHMAKGKDYVLIDETPPWFRKYMDVFAQEKNIHNNKLTLEQFSEFAHALRYHMQKGGIFSKEYLPDKGVKGGQASPGANGFEAVRGTTVGGDKVHKVRLKAGEKYTIRLKTMQSQGYDPFLWLLDENDHVLRQDDDGDGFPNSKIKFTPTTTAFYQLRCGGANVSVGQYELSIEGGGGVRIGPGRIAAGPRPGWGGGQQFGQPKQPAAIVEEPEPYGLDDRPKVYTGATLPPGLPDWFAKLDTDGDGQIGLYEWLAAKKPIAEFKVIDRNEDGFLTPDEVLYHVNGGASPTVSAPPPAKTPAFPGGDKKGKFGGDKKGFPFKQGK